MDAAITFAGDTHPGRMRRSNEDNFYLTPLSGSADHAAAMRNGYLFIVADGVGGNRGGARAGEMAVNRVPAFYYHAANGDPAHNLRVAFNGAAHEIVAEAVQNPDRASMSCTVVAAVVKDGAATIAHLGDARAYLWHGGALRPLTSDHTWVQMQVEKGTLTPEEALNHPDRNVITKSMGNPAFPEPTVTHTPLQPGDRLLLCSDGLSGVVPDAEIAAVLGRARDPGAATKELIDLANRKGGPDNVTAVVVQSGRALPAAAPRRSNSAPLLLMLVVAAALLIGAFTLFRPAAGGTAAGGQTTTAAVVAELSPTAERLGIGAPGVATSTLAAGAVVTETLTMTVTVGATALPSMTAPRSSPTPLPATIISVPLLPRLPVLSDPGFPCSPGNSPIYSSDGQISFRWSYEGTTPDGSELKIRFGYEGSSGVVQEQPSPESNHRWVITVPVNRYFGESREYQWRVFSERNSALVSEWGCFRVEAPTQQPPPIQPPPVQSPPPTEPSSSPTPAPGIDD